MTDTQDTTAYLEELAAALASHGSNLAALRRERLEQKVSPYLPQPGVPPSPGSVGGDSALAGLGSAYSTSVAMGAAGLFITDGALTIKSGAGVTTVVGGIPVLPVAVNLLKNAGFRSSSEYAWAEGVLANGWTFYGDTDTTATAAMQFSTEWALRDGDIDGWDGVGAPYGSSVYIRSAEGSASKSPFIVSQTVPVEAGNYYSASVLMGNHRCTAMLAWVAWFDTAGAFISSASLPNHAGTLMGGSWTSGWFLSKIEGVLAPATATQAVLYLRVATPYTSGTDMYGFFDQAMFVQGVVCPAWSPPEAPAVRNPAGEVVINSAGIAITNGKITVTNPGSTVIIDGTSNMFKIAASGTQSRTFPSGTDTTAGVTARLDALGNGYSTPPACHWNTWAWGSYRRGSYDSAVMGDGHVAARATPYVDLSGGYVVMGLEAHSDAQDYSGSTAYCRYYVFKEAGI